MRDAAFIRILKVWACTLRGRGHECGDKEGVRGGAKRWVHQRHDVSLIVKKKQVQIIAVVELDQCDRHHS